MSSHPRVPLSRSGFCQFPSTTEHDGCQKDDCTCGCHLKTTNREAGCPACDVPGNVPGSVMHAMHQKLAESTNHDWWSQMSYADGEAEP